jgi:hypothetical protein
VELCTGHRPHRRTGCTTPALGTCTTNGTTPRWSLPPFSPAQGPCLAPRKLHVSVRRSCLAPCHAAMNRSPLPQRAGCLRARDMTPGTGEGFLQHRLHARTPRAGLQGPGLAPRARPRCSGGAVATPRFGAGGGGGSTRLGSPAPAIAPRSTRQRSSAPHAPRLQTAGGAHARARRPRPAAACAPGRERARRAGGGGGRRGGPVLSHRAPLYSVDLMMSESPGSVMARTETRKYFPQAVPRSTLSGGGRGGAGGERARVKGGAGGSAPAGSDG